MLREFTEFLLQLLVLSISDIATVELVKSTRIPSTASYLCILLVILKQLNLSRVRGKITS